MATSLASKYSSVPNDFVTPSGDSVAALASAVLGNNPKEKRLGNGVCRDVYRLTNATVIKFARSYDVAYANIVEAAIWEIVKETPYADNFARVYAVAEDGSWLVQEYIEGEYDYGGDWEEEIRELRVEFGISDIHTDNYLVTDVGVVVFDYAGWSGYSDDPESVVKYSLEYITKYIRRRASS